MVEKSTLRTGEATLLGKIFDNASFSVVLAEAQRRNLRISDLRLDSITKDGSWKSTAESTVPVAVLYFKGPLDEDYLVAKRPEDKTYGLFAYRWTP